MSHGAQLREVLEQGSIVQQKEFLKGMIVDISLRGSNRRPGECQLTRVSFALGPRVAECMHVRGFIP